MSEGLRTPEPEPQIRREDVLAAYRPFVERGITNPDDLDLTDPEVKKANDLYDQWQAQEQAKLGNPQDSEALRQHDLALTMLYVDAGFTDPAYLEEVLEEWLFQDRLDTPKLPDNPARTETRRQLAAAVTKIKNLLRADPHKRFLSSAGPSAEDD